MSFHDLERRIALRNTQPRSFVDAINHEMESMYLDVKRCMILHYFRTPRVKDQWVLTERRGPYPVYTHKSLLKGE